MKSISKLFNVLSTISCIIAIILVYVFIFITESYYFNGYIILIFLCLLLNPVTNLFRLNKKRINNPIYHLIVIGLTSYISATSISSLKIYNQFLNFTTDNSIEINNALGCFGERFLYIMIVLIFLSLISFNPISLVLSCNLFIQLDKFGLNLQSKINILRFKIL